MPLQPTEIQQWWMTLFDDQEIPRAFTILRNHQYALYVTRNEADPIFIRALDNVSPMKLKLRGQSLLNLPPSQDNSEKSEKSIGTRLKDQWPFGLARWMELVEWMKTVAQINAEFDTAYNVSSFVIENCNTAGQINRALPELAQYLTGDAREALRDQKRASNMPYEWAAYDKERVMRASLALTKASLFPSSGEYRWQTVSTNWCTFKID